MRAFLRQTAPDQGTGEIPLSEEEVRLEARWKDMLKGRDESNEFSPAMLSFLRETPPDTGTGEVPASEEELRFEAAWTAMLERKRAKQAQSEAGNDPEHHNPTDPPSGKGSGGRTPS